MSDTLTMIDGFKVLISLGSFIVIMLGGIVVRDRNISKRISDGDAKSHSRIDALKDDVNENFARKDDVQNSVKRVERGIENLGNELRQNHRDLTTLIVKELKE